MTWRDNVRKVVPYIPGEQPKCDQSVIKLNTNENPYPPSNKTAEVISGFKTDRLKLYPNHNAEPLVRAIADYYNVKCDNVFTGVGSDDVLGMSFLTFFNSEKPILFPDITYSFYSVWADLFRIPYERPKLDKDFKLIKSDYYKENGGIVIPNPNAPTAIYEELDSIEDILAHNRGAVVIIDEAYIDFGGKSAVSLIDKYDNLLVVHTFSKSRSMAGMRIGYAIGNKELIKCLEDVKNSYNSYTMNAVSIEAGAASIEDDDYFKNTIDRIVKTRERVKKELNRLGFTYTDSMTNFIFASHKKVCAREIFEALREQNIYVRFFDTDRIDNYLRVSIGTDEEMDILISQLELILK